MIDCYFAVCEECSWEGEEWRSEGDAKAEGFEHREQSGHITSVKHWQI
jgi:hypothetical protein